MPLTIDQITPTEQLFTWINPDRPHDQITFATERLNSWLGVHGKQYIVRTPVTLDHAIFTLEKRGIEPHRLARLLRANARDLLPITLCQLSDNTHLTVDGNHRYLAAWLRKDTEILVWNVPESVWRKFTVEGFPPVNERELLNSRSGL